MEKNPVVLIPVEAEDVMRRKRRIVLSCAGAALLLAGIAGWIYQRSVDPLHAAESYDAGVRLLRNARYQQAILSFDRAIALKPDFADAFLMRARAYAGESKTEQAIADFTRAIELRPSDTGALLARGAAYLGFKDFQNAILDADHALAINAKLAQAFNLRAMAERSLGDPDKALEDFTHAVDLAPNVDNYYQRGATYQTIGRHKEAIADFTKVIAIDPTAAVGYFARAESRRAIGETRGADADHRRGRAIDRR